MSNRNILGGGIATAAALALLSPAAQAQDVSDDMQVSLNVVRALTLEVTSDPVFCTVAEGANLQGWIVPDGEGSCTVSGTGIAIIDDGTPASEGVVTINGPANGRARVFTEVTQNFSDPSLSLRAPYAALGQLKSIDANGEEVFTIAPRIDFDGPVAAGTYTAVLTISTVIE